MITVPSYYSNKYIGYKFVLYGVSDDNIGRKYIIIYGKDTVPLQYEIFEEAGGKMANFFNCFSNNGGWQINEVEDGESICLNSFREIYPDFDEQVNEILTLEILKNEI